MEIINKIHEANLTGRGGAGFPVCFKWQSVKNAKGDKKYIICNASEGEPGVFKDLYLLKNHFEDVLNGIKIAVSEIKADEAYVYINPKYYSKFKNKFEKNGIKVFKKPHHYIGGEETTLLNAMEGKRVEPRIRPPFPTESGLFNCPTLVNNVETFYYVSKISKGEYNRTRLYSISGDVRKPGVFEFGEHETVKKILEETKNYPKFPFFVMTGGGAVGDILLENELEKPADGAGAIIVFNKKTKPMALLKKLSHWFIFCNCDKCTPCREGNYRINEMLKNNKIDKEAFNDIVSSMQNSSFCALGKGAGSTYKAIVEKLI